MSVRSTNKYATWVRVFSYILLINFINLSANFYEGGVEGHAKMYLDDPIDNISEVIFEYILDGDGDVIPDNGTNQEDKSLKKLKVYQCLIPELTLKPELFLLEKKDWSLVKKTLPPLLSLTPPPPDRS
ncbi:hypothetical protein GYM62_06735 [Algoriphagus sp. NBT04N3]|uniref:hypothetical protein n=1 Tax=Algoriphagus sp. NBT04N3 TaxID=2705473 RepID=UPI001C62ED5E|nr:hypothetical protein [Algoriphagus sp. NBT04N3]QYH38509.1 hypothetical protein GYM62_06735 [Algoriphagus sp. NBT04N3]